MTQADATRALARRGQEDLGRRGVAVLLQEVVLDLPAVVEAEAVGDLDLLKRGRQQPALGVGPPGRAGDRRSGARPRSRRGRPSVASPPLPPARGTDRRQARSEPPIGPRPSASGPHGDGRRPGPPASGSAPPRRPSPWLAADRWTSPRRSERAPAAPR